MFSREGITRDIAETKESPKNTSETDSHYFEGWDDFQIEGNPELKDTIKKNILDGEIIKESEFKRLAEKKGVPVDDLKKFVQGRVESLIGNSDFFTAVNVHVLKRVLLEDQRFRSQFETHKSGAFYSPSSRSTREHVMFGFEDDISHDKEKRPIYGYFSDGENGEMNSVGKVPPPNNIARYGAISIKIKKEVALRKATITFQDSLPYCYSNVPPTPAARPHFVGLFPGQLERIVDGSAVNTRVPINPYSYNEAQYHGGLDLGDVESIHISAENGLNRLELFRIRRIFENFKKENPDSTIELVLY